MEISCLIFPKLNISVIITLQKAYVIIGFIFVSLMCVIILYKAYIIKRNCGTKYMLYM